MRINTNNNNIVVSQKGRREKEMKKWTVWSYDTWGNDQEGYTVNDRSEEGTIELPGEPTDADIMTAIEPYFDISRVTIDNGISDDTVIEIVLEEDDGYPVGQLVIED